jgi:hypothetical protein
VRARAPKRLVRGADMCGPLSIRNPERQDDARRISCSTERGPPGASVAQYAGPCSGQSPPDLFLEHLLDLPDLFFDFAGPVLGFAFSL